MPDRRLIANAVLFQLGWLACVLGGNSYWLAVPLVALLVHFFWTSSWAAEGKLVVSVMLAGAALDSFLLQLGVLEFRDLAQSNLSLYFLPQFRLLPPLRLC